MLNLLILALALSMDAFAVSIGLGSKHTQNTSRLAISAALYFGLFQALMPLFGFIGGKGVIGWAAAYAHWLALFLLVLIGAKMIYEAMVEGAEDGIAKITHRVMLTLAIATSIDAMAAGFTLSLLHVNPFLACITIGLITAIFSWLGVFIGNQFGTWLESKAEFIGGAVLIIVGLKIFISLH